MVIDGVGRFMSQRRCAKMALVSPSLPRTEDEVSLNGAAITSRPRATMAEIGREANL